MCEGTSEVVLMLFEGNEARRLAAKQHHVTFVSVFGARVAFLECDRLATTT